MCGIAGLWDFRKATAPEAMRQQLQAMAGALTHRGPDDSGIWQDSACGIGLAHRRLSIIDLSKEGHQPMASASGRYMLAYNGEIYNFETLRAELGARWRGHSDTEVMLAAFEAWGVEKALPRFNGMFAFALWDKQEKRLYLARDRMGEKPLYYQLTRDFCAFASELKALKTLPHWQGSIDRNVLSLFLRYNYVPAPYSIYHGVYKLLPGHWMVIEEGNKTPEVKAYWSVTDALGAPLWEAGEEEMLQHLETTLKTAVQQRMVADVPLGAFLSGGIDSSLMVALMQAVSTAPVHSFTIGFKEEGYNEAHHAREVAKHLGTQHTELYVSPEEVRGVIPKLPVLYDEPFADASQMPTFLVAQMARQQVTVALSGDGGDELFGGYNRYVTGVPLWQRLKGIPEFLRWGVAEAITAVPVPMWDRLYGFARRPGIRLGEKMHKLASVLDADSEDEYYSRLVSQWQRPHLLVEGAIEPPTLRTEFPFEGSGLGFSEWMMVIDSLMYMPDDILVKVDRAAMGVSLETRAPFLDVEVMALAARLPLTMKIKGGQGKWALRQVLHRYVPQAMVERPKMGFAIPIDSWLRGPLKEWAESLLAPLRLKHEGFLNPAPITAMWQQHLCGKHNHQYPLWGVLMFQSWLEGEQV